ncbi:DUF3540 domain-containing protein [Serratia sp. D1N4]
MSELIPTVTPRHINSVPRPSRLRKRIGRVHLMPIIVTDHVTQDDRGQLCLQHHTALALVTAASCLVQPQAGDLVSAVLCQRQAFVTAVLQRQQPETPLMLNSGNVPLHLLVPALEIHSPERVEIHTSHFSLLAHTSQWVAKTLHQVVDSLFVKAKHAHRQVENTDEVQARHINQQAEQSLIINSRIGSLNASAVLRIDGGQIHMG